MIDKDFIPYKDRVPGLKLSELEAFLAIYEAPQELDPKTGSTLLRRGLASRNKETGFYSLAKKLKDQPDFEFLVGDARAKRNERNELFTNQKIKEGG